MRVWRSGAWLALLVILIVGLVVVSGAASGAQRPEPSVVHLRLSPGAARLDAGRGRSFLSLWPACACGRSTELDAFSLATGRRVGPLARVRVAPGESVSPPASVSGGPVLLTFSSGPRCAGPPGGGPSAGPCEPLADSCSSRIERLDAGRGTSSTLLAVPPSTVVSDAVPSPDDAMIAMRSAGCATSYFDQSLVIRELATGRQWTIGADAPRCHAIGRPSWAPDGSRLVFAYRPSILRYGTKPKASEFCTAPRFGRLAIVPARRSSSVRTWKLVGADRKCSFAAAAFDSDGIAAVEACQRGPHGSTVALNVGEAYVVQLNRRDHVVERIALKPGWEDGLVSTDVRDGTVLVSQDQPANAGYPARDWVWQFDGHRLRLIASYRANDAAQVLAVPW